MVKKPMVQNNTLGLEGNAIPFSEIRFLAFECLWNKGFMSCQMVTSKSFITSSNLDFQNCMTPRLILQSLLAKRAF